MLLALPPLPPPTDTILVGAHVWIDHGKEASAKPGMAVVLSKNRILAVGPEADLVKAHPKATRVELKGGTLLPGFIEGHAHVGGVGTLKTQVNLAWAASLVEVGQRIKTWMKDNPTGWIQGRGWDQNLWPTKAFPTAKDLDAFTGDRPAAMDRVDGHALWVNSAALKAAGITAQTPDPAGGRIIRDAQGNPTGVFIDAASSLVESRIPGLTQAAYTRTLRQGLLELRRQGFTAVADMGGGKDAVEAYRAMQTAGTLPIRVFLYISPEPKLMEVEFAKPFSSSTSFFRVQGPKLFLDGALGSRGARMLTPYADEPSTLGLWVRPPAVVEGLATRAMKQGYQPAIHAIGDGANRVGLDLLARAIEATKPKLQPRIEHAQIVAPEDAPRFGKLGVVASVQPIHLADDHAWTPTRLGPQRAEETFPWRTFLENGASFCFGSDAPVADPNPFWGMAAAETRQDAQGQPEGGFLPKHRVTRSEAIRAYTLANAQVLGAHDLGRIEEGALADLLWVQAPITTLSPTELRALKPGRLWVNGKEVKDQGFGAPAPKS